MSALTTLTSVSPPDAQLLDNLWQFYELESSFWSQEDVDAEGRFNSLSGFLDDLGEANAIQSGYFIRHDGQLSGLLIVGRQQLQDREVKELSDLYVLPKFRGRGIASEIVRHVVLESDEPWLICVFRNDLNALRFWERAFERLAFSSVRELLPAEYPELREFIVNET